MTFQQRDGGSGGDFIAVLLESGAACIPQQRSQLFTHIPGLVRGGLVRSPLPCRQHLLHEFCGAVAEQGHDLVRLVRRQLQLLEQVSVKRFDFIHLRLVEVFLHRRIAHHFGQAAGR